MDFRVLFNKGIASLTGSIYVIKMTEKLLPLAAMEKVIKKVGGADTRVSDKAKVALKAVLEEEAEELALRAWRLATHAGRKTVKEGDIKLAAKQ